MNAARLILGVTGLALFASPVAAWDLPTANKLMVLVSAEGCDRVQLGRALDRAARTLVSSRHTSRVVLDLPADPERNLDLTGKPSPILAVLEANASAGALADLARRVTHAIPSTCRSAAYFAHERRYLANSRRWQLGRPSPGTKTITTLVRKEGVTIATFDTEWGGPHAQITMAARRAAGEGGSHYVQNLAVGRLDKKSPALDGIGEGGSDGTGGAVDIADRMKTAAHAATFTAMARSTMFLARETVLKD